MIETSRRLRRAILLNDLSLVRRIITNNPLYLRNPDFEDRSNTSLHLAARHGFTAIAELLIEAGHENDIVSRNNEWETPLMLAAVAGKEEMGVMLAKRFPGCIGWKDKAGLDALMLSCKSGAGTLHLIPTLLNLSPPILLSSDITGNTALHHASAAGELKALRILLQYGANPLTPNAYSWTPVHYSATPAAEAYFKTLIVEFEKIKAESARKKNERERQRTAGVRLVTSEEGMAGFGIQSQSQIQTQGQGHSQGPTRASGETQRYINGGAGGVQNGGGAGIPRVSGERYRARDDAAIAGLPAPGVDWSPVERRRAMTPTEGRNAGWGFLEETRPRADSGG